jgi:Asp-tRNA(Asn)/Glu-tRNA(Gln) amidotransferase A subunit family amidase
VAPGEGAGRVERRPGGGGGGGLGAAGPGLGHGGIDPPTGCPLRRGGGQAHLGPRLALGAGGVRLVDRPDRPPGALGARRGPGARRHRRRRSSRRDLRRASGRRLPGAHRGGLSGVKIGVLSEIDAGKLSAAAGENWRAALARLEAAGAELVEVSVPSLDAAISVYYILATAEASANLARFDGVRYGRRAATGGSLLDLYVESRSQGFGPEVKRRIMLGTFALSSGYYDAYYGRARAVCERMRHELAGALRVADLVATPTSPSAAFRLGEKIDDPLEMYLSDVFTTPASLVGLPAVSVPSGADDRGLPLGLQLTGRPFAEATVLAAARAFEREVGWSVAPTFQEAAAA